MTKKRRAAWYKLFSIMMVLSLLAGMVVPVAPAVAYAEGEDALLVPDLTRGVDDPLLDSPGSPLESTAEDDAEQMAEDNAVTVEEAPEENTAEDDAEEDTVTNTVYGEATPESTSMGVGTLSEGPTVKVFGDGVENEIEFSVDELWEWKTERPDDWVGPRVFSTINTWPTKRWYAVEGVKLSTLLEEAGIKDDTRQIKVRAVDGYVMTFTKKELLEDTRYYFPKLKENHEFAGHIPGSPDGAEPVEAIIALKSVENSANFGSMTPLSCPLFVLGQRAVTEQTNHTFVKDVRQIEVLTAPTSKWTAPVANQPAGEVPVGTEVVLTNQFNDADKIYYTTDGSDPTLDSPIYNWIASRWWSSRAQSDEDNDGISDLDEINCPIVITEDTTIKAKTIGFGREDSDIATFEYTVPKVPVTGVSISEGDQELEVGETVQLTAVVEPEDATDKSITWSSSNEAVATVDETGLLTAVAEGTATITVTTTDGDFTDSITVTVVPTVLEPLNPPALVADSTDNTVGNPIELTFTDDEDWRNFVNEVTVNGSAIASDDYTLAAGKLTIGASVFTAGGEYTIVVKATGYEDATVTQILTASDFVVEDGVLVKYKGAGGDVVIPGDLSITAIGSMAFAYLDNLTSVVIPEGVTTIGGIAFEGCTNLTTVVLPESVNKIGAFAFAECHNLTQINIPEAVTCIEKETFYRCHALTSVRLPNGITSIEEAAFQQCSSLSEINIPDAVTYIGKNAFRSCSALSEIVIPGNVTSVADSAFPNCKDLVSVTILSRDTTFGNGVFDNSPNVTIYGYSGSTAEAYANENDIPFEPLGSVDIPLTIVVKEDGTEVRTVSYNMADWETAQQRYSARDSMPAYRLGAAEGVFLEDLLEDADIDISKITGFKFVSTDEYAMPISKSELLDVPRYYYPNIFEADQEEGAEPVKPMLALKSYVGARGSSEPPSWDMIDDQNTIRLFAGQKNPEDINYGLFAKYICEIEVELETSDVPVTGVEITPTGGQELEIGETVQLTAVVEPEEATDKSVTWSSDNEAVATVDGTGLVTAVAAGTATITVTTTDGGFADSIEVTVASAPVVFTVEINGELIEAYTMADLKAMPATTKAYGSTGFYKRTGVDFIYLLEFLDIDYQNWTVKLKYTTGGSVTLDFSVVTEPLLCYEENGNPFPTNNPLRLCYGDGSNHNILYNYVAGIEVIKPETLTPPELIADSTDNIVGNPIELTFTDDEDWRNAVNEVTVNGSAIASDDYTLAAGKLTIDASVFTAAGEYTIVVKAAGYEDATVTQTLTTEGFPYIVSITGVDDVEVPIGTAEADAIAALASETTIMDSDGETHTVALEWTIDCYDGNTAGDYTATGTFELPEGVEQSDPPLDLEVQATINIIDLTSDFVIEDGVLVKYKGVGGDVVIPGNLGITTIGERVFMDCSGLTSVEIPEGVTGIEYGAFVRCSNLLSVSFPASLLEIGGNAFQGCSGLPSIEIPEGVTTINYGAFNGCSGLISIEIPDSVTEIGHSAFRNCSGLTSITLPGDITIFDDYLLNGCSSLTTYEIPEGVTSIGNSAFGDCSSLSSISIPESVEAIKWGAFENCTSLTEVYIPDSVTDLGNNIFQGCSNLTLVRLSESITSVSEWMFKNCSSLTSIEIPEGVTNIKRYAFQNCSSLTSVTIPSSVITFGDKVFDGCEQVTIYGYSGSTAETYANDNDIPFVALDPAYTVTLSIEPAGGGTVTGAGEYAEGESVTVEAQAAEGYAFVNWTDAEGEVSTNASYTFNMPAEAVSLTANFEPVSDFVVVDGVLVEYKGAGGDVVIPGDLGITSIGDEVFRELETLTSVIIPEGVSSIGEYAFYKCSNLTAADIPNSVNSIGKVAFGDCSSLATVTIPEGVTVIKDYTFQNCSSLNTVILPETVTQIDSQAFVFCSSLTEIILPDNLKTIGSNTFFGCSSLAEIILPDDLETIETGAFNSCSSLTAITIPEKVTVINGSTFKDCTSLSEVTIPEGVTVINLWAFRGCSSLNKIIIPRSVEEIKRAFLDCDQLTIYGYSGSTAETYANDNDIPFVALDAYNMLSVEAEPADIPIGDSFTVSVNVENIRDVQGYEVTLKYDPAYAEYKGHQVNFKPGNMALKVIEEGKITVANFVLGDAPWEQDSGALVEVEFESRYPGTIEGGVYDFTFEEIEVVLEPRDGSDPTVREKLDSPVVKYYEGSDVDIYAALELREEHGGITSNLQNGSDYEATTGSDGSATFEMVRPGEYSLTLEADGYLKALVEGVVVTFGEENQVGTALNPVLLYAGDVNGDGKICIMDIALAANEYGQAGDPGWVIEDLNLDGKVNISDLAAIARNFDLTTAETTYNYKDEAPYWE